MEQDKEFRCDNRRVAPLRGVLMESESSPMPRNSIESVIYRILESGIITNADKNWLYRATLSEISLTSEQVMQVRRVMDRLQMGLVRVVE